MPRLCGKDCRSALKFTNTGPRVCIELKMMLFISEFHNYTNDSNK